MGRLIVVSNRVAPITEGKPAQGGLAVGIMDALQETGGIWFGWSGNITTAADPQPVVETSGPITQATIDLTQSDYDRYYKGFSNATLWPTFHYRIELSQFDRKDYEGYVDVNGKFARHLCPLVEADDLIWVHDYQLIPFAEQAREAGLGNRIGFFLHIPFPAPEVLRTIPKHEALVRCLSAYDLVGFQTETDLTAFTDYIVRVAGGTVTGGRRVAAFGRTLTVGVYPIGVYPDQIRQHAVSASARKHVRTITDSLQGRRLIMSVDRLDYTKGLLERFRAFERLLEDCPEQTGRVSFLQIAPPSRSDLQTYRQIRRALEGETGRINGRFAELDWTPIRYLNRGFSRPILMALLANAEVGLVTPLRDGMNLIAKEYVAAQDPDNPGVLVLSQFAGAALELTAALRVNPHDVVGMAEALARALTMTREERRARHAELLAVLKTNDLSRWRDRFIADLQM